MIKNSTEAPSSPGKPTSLASQQYATKPMPRRAPWHLPWRLAWRELLGSKVFAISFVINLSLGLTGFLTLSAFKESLADHLGQRSKSILAADLVVSGRRLLSDEESLAVRQLLPPGSDTRREQSLMSMAAAGTGTRLVDVRAIDDKFPFYGSLTLQDKGAVVPGGDKIVVHQARAWVYPEILVQLGAQIGDEIKIGERSFIIDDVIIEDPSASSVGFALAPKVVIGLAFLADTELISKGSRVFERLLIKLPPGVDETKIAEDLRTAIASRELRIRTHETASEELSRLLIYLNDYLGLVSLVALFLAGIGAAFLFRSYLARRYKDIAIMLSLGAELGMARFVHVIQLVLLGTAATLFSVILAQATLPALPRLMAGIVPADLKLGVAPLSIGLVLLMGTLGSLVFCLPLLARLAAIKPSELFQEAANPRLETRGRALLWWMPALALYWLLAMWQANSIKTGSLFIALFFGSGLVFAIAALMLLLLIEKDYLRRIFPAFFGGIFGRLACLNLARHKAASLTCLLAISLGSLLVNLVPQIRATLDAELASPGGEEVPGLFMFDIQEEQLAALESELAARQLELRYVSPLVRARLMSINGAELGASTDLGNASTREEEQESRTQNRSYNLSYRLGSAPSETIIEGEPIVTAYDASAETLPKISLETRFAQRLGVGIGDKLSFDVQGVSVDAEVVNLRRVRWASFHPNFFVQFQPGVLDDAPKSFLAAIPDLPFAEKVALQTELVGRFPNVSIIDVTSTVSRILGIVEQMSSAIAFMALLSLIAGIAVLYSIARYQAAMRLRDMALLKVLGASFGSLRLMLATEFLILGVFASSIGALVSIGVSYGLSVSMFDGFFAADPRLPLLTTLGIGGLCLLAGLTAAAKSLRTKPALLLNGAQA